MLYTSICKNINFVNDAYLKKKSSQTKNLFSSDMVTDLHIPRSNSFPVRSEILATIMLIIKSSIGQLCIAKSKYS